MCQEGIDRYTEIPKAEIPDDLDHQDIKELKRCPEKGIFDSFPFALPDLNLALVQVETSLAYSKLGTQADAKAALDEVYLTDVVCFLSPVSFE